MSEPPSLNYRNPQDEAVSPPFGQIMVGVFFLILTLFAGAMMLFSVGLMFLAVVSPEHRGRRAETFGSGMLGLLIFVVTTKALYRITRRQFEKRAVVNDTEPTEPTE